jgi:alcohol dehydrogenase
MQINPFTIARLPRILFGPGRMSELGGLMTAYGKQVLIVTGARSFRETAYWTQLCEELQSAQIIWQAVIISGEPSPQTVDEIVAAHRGEPVDVVVGIGGGSVLDAAKAIAGLLLHNNSVMDHLEGVGANLPYMGPSVPFIAVPTTAGTGSEATKNAVLSEQGPNGFKKSFRHDTLVAQVALVDPDLLSTCPSALVAADGMDAFTQLLESYVSLRANPLNDALALSGLEAFRDGFWTVWENAGFSDGSSPPAAKTGRSCLAYASLVSGINLAQTGLGSVHGLASPLGAFFPAPHGAVCGTLVAEATDINLTALRERAPDSPALAKYARVGELLSGHAATTLHQAQDGLVSRLREWTERLNLPRLREFGMTESDVPKVVANSRGSSMTTNPLALTDEEVAELVRRRL